jgi:hypothetical protein
MVSQWKRLGANAALAAFDVARPHSVGEDRGLVDERRDLVVHVGPIFVYGREDYSVLGATAEIRRDETR